MPDPEFTDVSVDVEPNAGTQHETSIQVSADATLTLKWATTGASGVLIDGLGEFGPSGEQSIPTQDATYVLTAHADDGTSSAPYQIDIQTHDPADVVSPHIDLGSGAQGDLFGDGIDFMHHPPGEAKGYAGTPVRVWAHPDAHKAGKVPLLIYLHGNNRGLKQQAPALFAPDMDKQGSMHVGKLLTPLIDAGDVGPLVVACPWVFKNNGDKDDLWTAGDFDLGTLVREIMDLLGGLSSDNYVVVDPDCVAITGHSGAGGTPGNGLNRVLEHKGSFSTGASSHDITLLGVMDTRTDDTFGSVIRNSLGPKKIDAYLVHRPGGGWRTGSHADLCKGLAVRDAFALDPSFEKEAGLLAKNTPLRDEYQRRISIAVTKDDGAWTSPGGDWAQTGGYKQYGGWEHHFDVTVIWTLWAARRYFAPGACQQRNAARAQALKGCEDCDALQKMIDTGDVGTRLKAGSKDGDAVEHLQRHLVAFGYRLPGNELFPDGVDGGYGGSTSKALAAFLKDISWTGDGLDGKAVTPEIATEIIQRHQQGYRRK